MAAGGVAEIRARLAKGIYVDNMHEMVRTCLQMARSVEEPLPFYVMAKVLDTISEDWENHPVTSATYDAMQRRISGALDRALSIIQDGRPACETWDSLNELVRRFLREDA
jgi:hypothetical protein